MAGDNFRRVSVGTPISKVLTAPLLNELLDMIRERRLNKELRAQEQLGRRDQDIILVRNESGSDRKRFEVLGYDEPIFKPDTALGPFQRANAFIGTNPTVPAFIGKFCILLEPLKEGKIGKAAIGGIMPVKLDVWFETARFADVIDGACDRLETTEYGSEIVWKEEGTGGGKWALVRLGQFHEPPLIVSWDDSIEFGVEKEAFVHDEGGRSERTIGLFASIIGSSSGRTLETVDGELNWAHLHRQSGIYELGANSRMLDLELP